MMKNEFAISPGAVFKVTWKATMSECREFEGTYKGLSVIGSETAMVFDVDGTLRFLTASSVVCMDQTVAAPEEPAEKKDLGSVFYG